MGSEFRRIHPFSGTLASPSGPRTGLSGGSSAFVCVQAVLPLPWQWGHKSRLRLLHRGSVIYACPAGIVNFFLMFKIRHSRGGRGASGSLWRSRLLSDLPAMLLLAPQAPPRALDPAAQLGSAELLSDQREGFQKPEADAHSGDQDIILFLRPVLPPVSLGLRLCMWACLYA